VKNTTSFIKRDTLKRITSRQEFCVLANELGVRDDWHEPDEQEVTVEVRGSNFDNAGFWPEKHAVKNNDGDVEFMELCVFFKKGEQRVAVVNLAMLCAWAAGLED